MEIKTRFDEGDKVIFMFESNPTWGIVEEVLFRPIDKAFNFTNERVRINYLIRHADMFGTIIRTEVSEIGVYSCEDELFHSLRKSIIQLSDEERYQYNF